ncbi:MAG: chemotaxis-specific protein-glutamate methyltransferase CheB, partial [Planctomycetota bacterium]
STQGIDVAAIMVSAFTARGAKATTEALSLGAFDFILKPTTNSLDESILQLRRDLLPKLRAAKLRRPLRAASKANTAKANPPGPARPKPPAPQRRKPLLKPDVVAIGVSTGGPQALGKVIPQLPADFPTPIVIVQHMPPMFTKSLAEDLDRKSKLHVAEATQGQPLRRGEVLIAPGGRQMRVIDAGAGPVIQLTDDPPERNCKPAVDYLFRSVASTFGSKALGVVLTGMGDDGAEGCDKLAKAGARVVAQDEATCVVYGMPKAVVDAGLADAVVPLPKIATQVTALASGRALV